MLQIVPFFCSFFLYLLQMRFLLCNIFCAFPLFCPLFADMFCSPFAKMCVNILFFDIYAVVSIQYACVRVENALVCFFLNAITPNFGCSFLMRLREFSRFFLVRPRCLMERKTLHQHSVSNVDAGCCKNDSIELVISISRGSRRARVGFRCRHVPLRCCSVRGRCWDRSSRACCGRTPECRCCC